MDELVILLTFLLAFWLGRESMRATRARQEISRRTPPTEIPRLQTREQAIRQVLS